MKEFLIGFLERHPDLLTAFLVALLDEIKTNPKVVLDIIAMLK